jgi:soluble lytic murein transglycosylase
MTLRRPTLLLLVALAACTRGDDANPLTRADDGDVTDVAIDGPARSDAEAIVAMLPAGADPAVRDARAALAMDASWRATAALAPALADPARRTPTVLVLAAAAAAERDEWSTVTQLAGTVPDSAALGFGPLLLARSALARGVGAPAASRVPLARAALDAARRSAAHARDATERGVRLTLAARALDRLAGVAEDTTAARPADAGDARALADSTRAAYAAAAALMPSVADWLSLRAAEVTRDAGPRARTLAALTLPAARERAPSSEAVARERAGDVSGAAAAYAAAGRRAKALSLRLALAGTDAARRAVVRDSLVKLVAARSGTGEAREAVDLLDAFGALAPAEELVVARSANASGPASRAVSAYGRALGAGLGTPNDRYVYALLLARAGRSAEARTQLARVAAAGGPLAGDAAYQRARLLLRAPGGARAALEQVARAHADDTEAAASALYLLADLAIDDGRDADARATLLRLAREHPTSARAPRARFDAAIIALAGGDAATAARELDALRAARTPTRAGGDTTPSEEVVAATYWAGRAAAAAGDESRARERWREVAARVPSSYYAMLAERRLGRAAWAPNGTGDAPPDPVVAAAVGRLALLERVGFDPEAGWERDGLARWADTSGARLVAVGRALGAAGATSSGIRLTRRALERGAPATAAAYRALYPWPWEPLVREAARARDMDPTLAAAVIRQESNFTPGATSPAGAVGLMQLMPPVGRSLWDALGAARAGVPWSTALLRQPDVSVALGTRHLATSLAQYPDVTYALAAYNAGGTPVARWRRRAGAGDPELFVERIPYDETRDYVRIVTRNRAFYQALYGER